MNISRPIFRLVPLVAAGLFLFLGEVENQARPPGERSTVRGRVERFTTGPKGETDGAVLDDGTWLHWPPHMQNRFTAILKKGDRVRATGRMEAGPKGDSHFEVEVVTNVRTNETAENPNYANGPPPRGKKARMRRARGEEVRTVRGKVQRFTSAPKGETDGALLDDGTWLHWPPHMQNRFASILRKGDPVRATGWIKTGKKGDTRFEVQSVTNLRSNQTTANPDFPLPQRIVAPLRPADREQRLRDLEDQVEQLRREIQKLRREK